MNIGLVTDFYYPWIGGPATLIRLLARELSARGHRVSILAPSPDGPGREEWDGEVQVTRVRTVPTPFGYNLRTALRPNAEVAGWLQSFQPSALNVHHPFVLSHSSISAARARNIPVLATNHTIPACSLYGLRGVPGVYPASIRAFGAWINRTLGRCTAVATPTTTAANLLRDLGFQRAIEVVSNGVDATRFRPREPDEALRASLGLDSRPVVLYTGRLDAEKDMGTWLRAARQLAVAHDVQFAIGGKGSDRDRLERLAADLGLSGRTRFFGYLPEETYPAVYNLAQVYFMASPVELQSITTLEAVASGLPIVAADAGALPELVSNNNGALFAPGDADAAASALAAILANSEVTADFGRRSRDLSLAHDVQRTVDTYEGLLRRLVGAGDGREQAALARG